jgi:hypothetical protein
MTLVSSESNYFINNVESLAVEIVEGDIHKINK